MPFEYTTDFPGNVPGHAAQFSRTFHHEDWIDGESVVQAEANAVEDGFNHRFHRIEADLDALNADAVLAFGALATMRNELRALLDEIRVELQRLDTSYSEPWRNLTLIAPWRSGTSTDFDVPAPGCFRDRSGVIHLRGWVRGGPQPGAGGAPIAQLPAGYGIGERRMSFAAASWNQTTVVRVLDAVVVVDAPFNDSVSLDGICFRP